MRTRSIAISAGIAACVVATVAGVAHADTFVPNAARSATTPDGWVLTAAKTNESVTSVPGLDQSPFTREGFIAVDGTADVTGHGRTPITAGTVIVGYQVGCNVDVGSGVNLGLSASFGPQVNVNISTGPGVTAGLNASLSPTVSTSLKPGTITTIPLGTKTLAGAHAGIGFDQTHIKVDGCLGPVSLRSYVTAAVSTAGNDNTVTVYGAPTYL